MLNDFMVVRRRDQLGSIYFGGRYWLLVVALSGRLCDVSYRLVETCGQGHHDDIYFQYEFFHCSSTVMYFVFYIRSGVLKAKCSMHEE